MQKWVSDGMPHTPHELAKLYRGDDAPVLDIDVRAIDQGLIRAKQIARICADRVRIIVMCSPNAPSGSSCPGIVPNSESLQIE